MFEIRCMYAVCGDFLMKLKKPTFQIPIVDGSEISDPQASTARFIASGDRRPDSGRPIPATFRLPQTVIDALEEEAGRTGQNKTTILKAAVMAYSFLEENEKNKWLLDSMKMSSGRQRN
ncbi:Stability/partitioning protein [Pseudomonas amygdali pv. lachrymans]|uniref:Stability/partitioning protein n=1 Tax=Pseudomonas amygdali pv. lachrymans TaxID=53707 RepID=A0AB37R2J0_PSEAV|nr:Stability/partitioning protein [Pseudomonas amygdali pv. lachrymans]